MSVEFIINNYGQKSKQKRTEPSPVRSADLASSFSSHHTIIVVTVMIIITINIIIMSNEINGNTDSANTNTATLP